MWGFTVHSCLPQCSVYGMVISIFIIAIFIFHYCRSKCILTLSTLGKIFSRRHFDIFFLFFPENRIWHFMQRDSFCIKCKILFFFFLKNKKNIVNLSSAENAQRVVKVKLYVTLLCHSHILGILLNFMCGGI